MKQFILFLTFSIILQLNLTAGVYILDGIYQGEDIYVQNPFSNEGVGFCIYEVLVNGEVTSDEINSSAFAVDLTQYEFALGDAVTITIRSKSECTPNIINPDAISPRSTCKITDVELEADGTLKWNTVNENGQLPFIVEHYKWNKWVQIGSVLGEGNTHKTKYEVGIRLPAGENKIRIKQKDYEGEKVTDELTLTVTQPTVELISQKVNTTIDFTGSTHYELFNAFGEIVTTGYANSCDVSHLKKGMYYLNYEMTSGTEIKKK